MNNTDSRITRLEEQYRACTTIWQPTIEKRLDRIEKKIDGIDDKMNRFLNDDDWHTLKTYMRRENIKNFRAGSDPIPDEDGTISEIHYNRLPKVDLEESDRVYNRGTYIKFGGGAVITLAIIAYVILKMYGMV